MHIRRIVKAGVASFTVSLPKEWLESQNLRKGDLIAIHEQESSLILSPHREGNQSPIERHETTINIDGRSMESIQRELTSAYLNNTNVFIFRGQEVGDKVKDLRKMLRAFTALETQEQTADKLVAQELLASDEISVEKSLNRMDMIVRTMLDEAKQSLKDSSLRESIILKDYEINKLHFLLVRLLRGTINGSSSIKIDKKKIIPCWTLTTNLEAIGDAVKEIITLSEKAKGSEIKKLETTLESLRNLYLDAMKSQYNKDKELADNVIKTILESQSDHASVRQIHWCVNNIAKSVLNDEIVFT